MPPVEAQVHFPARPSRDLNRALVARPSLLRGKSAATTAAAAAMTRAAAVTRALDHPGSRADAGLTPVLAS